MDWKAELLHANLDAQAVDEKLSLVLALYPLRQCWLKQVFTRGLSCLTIRGADTVHYRRFDSSIEGRESCLGLCLD